MLLFIASVAVGSLLVVGCEDDTTAPTVPTVQYRPQNFFIAVGNGSQPIGNHNQSSAVTINWNGTSGTNAPVPVHVAVVPHCDGLVDANDNGAWDAAQEVDIPLTPVDAGKDSGVSNLKMKIVFNFATPATAYFLMRWQDSEEDIWKHPFAMLGATRKFGAPEYEEDWVAFMWDVWKKYPAASDPLYGTVPQYFERQTANFQTQGCAIACHDEVPNYAAMSFLDDSAGRSYTDPYTGQTVNASPILDVWFWGAGRTNCGDDPLKTAGEREPSWIVDAQITPGESPPVGLTSVPTHGIRKEMGQFVYDNTMKVLQFEIDANLFPPYALNFDTGLGGPAKQRADDPNSGEPYVWSATAEPYDPQGWVEGSFLGGWLAQAGLGKAGNVQAQGVWANGWWTVELEHQVDDGDDMDTIIGTFDPH